MSTNRPAHGSAVVAVLLTAPFLAQADATIANVATPSIQSGLGASAAAAELVIGGYLTAYAVLLITGARLGQTLGYHRLFLGGATAFGITSLLAGLAPNPWILVAARVVQGAGAAMMYPQALTGIQMNFAGSARTRAIGSFALALAAGAVSGQILGGVLISADIAGTGWRGIFLINVPICVAVVVAGLRYLPRGEAQLGSRLDGVGVLTLSASLLLVVLPLSLGRTQGWPAWTWICLIAGVPAFVLFLITQHREARRGGQPLINLHVVARPAIVTALLSLLVATGTYYALLFTLAQYLQQGLGRSALFSGLAVVPWVAAFGLAGQITRRLPSRFARWVAPVGYTLMTVVYAVLAAGLIAGTTIPDTPLLILLAIGGLGLGAGFNGLLGHLTNSVPTRYAPDISGVSTTTLQVGGAVGVAALGTLYLGLAPAATDVAAADHAFGATNVVYALCAATAGVLSVIATGRRPVNEDEVDEVRARLEAEKDQVPDRRPRHRAKHHIVVPRTDAGLYPRVHRRGRGASGRMGDPTRALPTTRPGCDGS